MDVLVVGNGGREHALTWKLRRSEKVMRLYATRPNAGQARLCEAVDLAPTDVDGIAAFVQRADVDLTVIGPEAPLAAGLADVLRAEGRRVVGPGRDGARLEASKAFAKDFLRRHGIPTAGSLTFDTAESALAHLKTARYPLVLKADGLAAGKGVAICHDADEAAAWVHGAMTDGRFGAAGGRVVVEDFLAGEEVSVIVLTDGRRYVALPTAQDHKARDDGDRGPNTGGMGAYSPAPLVTPPLWERIQRDVLDRSLAGLRADGIDFRGFLYAGLMIVDGTPYVLEYNVRLGDPEAQPILARLRSDLLPLLVGAAEGALPDAPVEWDPRPAVCVVLASAGYPEAVSTGHPIHGLEEPFHDGVVFHGGTRREAGRVVNSGGRVLGVTALGTDLPEAIARAYRRVDGISFQGSFHRRDIGAKALAHLETR
jgi:phosphoribosylamine--glycine ligase